MRIKTAFKNTYKQLFAFGLLLGLAFSISAQDSQTKYNQLFKEAIDAEQAENYDLVVSKTTEMIILAPKVSLPYFLRGAAYVRQKNSKNAILDFTSALEMGLDDREMEGYVYKLRGVSYKLIDEKDKAINDFSKAIALNDKDHQDFDLRADLYLQKGEIELAIKDIDRSIELEPKQYFSYFLRAKVFVEKKNDQKALTAINEAIKLKSDGSNFYKLRADIYRKMGKSDLAEKDDEKVSELTKVKDSEDKDTDEGKNGENNSTKIILDRSQKHFDDGEWEEAIRGYTEILKQIGENSEGAYAMFFIRGRSYFELNNLDAALSDYNKSIALAPEMAGGWTFRGEVFLKKNEYQAALLNFNKAVELDNRDILAYRRRAELFYLTEEYDKAIADSTKVLDMDSTYQTGWYFRGLSHLKKGNYQNALNDISKYLEFSPKDGETYLVRAEIYRKLNKPKEALKDEKKAIELGIDESNQ